MSFFLLPDFLWHEKSLNKNKNPGATLEKQGEYKYTFTVFARKYTAILS